MFLRPSSLAGTRVVEDILGVDIVESSRVTLASTDGMRFDDTTGLYLTSHGHDWYGPAGSANPCRRCRATAAGSPYHSLTTTAAFPAR
jgi:hypothetical protein